MPFTPTSYSNGTIHHYHPRLIAYEFPSPSPSTTIPPSSPKNYLLFIPGLGDTLLSVSYIHALAPLLPPPWTLISAQLSSSGQGWGCSSLSQDALEIGQLISYLRHLLSSSTPPGKIVLLGHSTGCQDALTYANKHTLSLATAGNGHEDSGDTESYPPVDGIILQAPVSDREGLEMIFPPSAFAGANQLAAQWISSGRGKDVLPFSLTREVEHSGVPVSAERWLSMTSPGPGHEGEDDLFSSDLGDGRLEGTWGSVGRGVRVLVLYDGEDQHVPAFVDKEALVRRWVGFLEGGGSVVDSGSGVVEGADHSLSELCGEGVRGDVFGRIGEFLGRV
ncbi:hypothetical protein MMC10_006973 [Thelotrema lepadinum]|nr:hypothetical protein [Thelotrema lepadinum]